MARFLFFILLLIFFQCGFAQEPVPDTINTVITVEAKDALFYQQQAKRAGDPAVALEFLKKALELRSAAQDDDWVADVRVEMANQFFKAGDSKQAFSELLTAEKIYTASGNQESRAEVMLQMARFYEKNAAWAEAVKYYGDALKFYESINSLGPAANISLHLADIALNQDQLAKADKAVSYAVKQYKSLNDKTGIGLSYVKLAEIYRRRKQYSKAERLILDIALPYFRSTGYKAGRIGCFDVLGKIYQSQKRQSEAKWFFIQANTQARALNDLEGVIISLINLSKVKIAIADYNLAKRDLKEAQSLAARRGNLFLLAKVKEAYALLYKKTGDQNRSDHAIASSEELKDSLSTYLNAQAESARTARVRFETRKKERKPSTVSVPEDDDFFGLKMAALVLAILAVLLLILRRIK